MMPAILVAIGLTPLVIIGGLIYSTAFIRSSHYGAFIIFAIIYGFFCYLLFLFSRPLRSSALLWVPALIIAGTGPFFLGHYYGYTDSKDVVYQMVQDDADGEFNPAWKKLDRNQVFDRYAQSVTGNHLVGLSAYLSLMAHEGWSGFERSGAISVHIERRGIWVWMAWGFHIVFLLVVTAVAMGATITEGEMKKDAKRRPKKKNTIRSTDPESRQKQTFRKSPTLDEDYHGLIRTFTRPENEQKPDGWWLIAAKFRGREVAFRAYYTEKPPKGPRFFEDLRHVFYLLRNEGPLVAVAAYGSIEGGLTNKEAVDQLLEDERKTRYLLGSYYPLFESDEKFFSVFFSADDRGREKGIKTDE